MKILLALDISKFSEAATEALIRQMRPESTEVRVLHIVEPLLVAPQFLQADFEGIQAAEKALMEEGKGLLREAEERLRKAGFKAQVILGEGDPRAVIMEEAKHWNADLIVLGSHGRKGLDRFLMGSVAEFVARHAHCSVLIVRMAEASAASAKAAA